MIQSPTTPAGLRSLDHESPVDAIVRAWTEPGRVPRLHRRLQDTIRRSWPLLGRSLDRLALERKRPQPFRLV